MSNRPSQFQCVPFIGVEPKRTTAKNNVLLSWTTQPYPGAVGRNGGFGVKFAVLGQTSEWCAFSCRYENLFTIKTKSRTFRIVTWLDLNSGPN